MGEGGGKVESLSAPLINRSLFEEGFIWSSGEESQALLAVIAHERINVIL